MTEEDRGRRRRKRGRGSLVAESRFQLLPVRNASVNVALLGSLFFSMLLPSLALRTTAAFQVRRCSSEGAFSAASMNRRVFAARSTSASTPRWSAAAAAAAGNGKADRTASRSSSSSKRSSRSASSGSAVSCTSTHGTSTTLCTSPNTAETTRKGSSRQQSTAAAAVILNEDDVDASPSLATAAAAAPRKPRASAPDNGPTTTRKKKKAGAKNTATASAIPATTDLGPTIDDAATSTNTPSTTTSVLSGINPIDPHNGAHELSLSDGLLHPLDLFEPVEGVRRIPYPKALSPSSIKEFQACPQSFFFQYLLGLKQPTTEALAKGSMCHAALERVFDLDPPDRSLAVLQNLFRTAWSEHRLTDVYRPLFEQDEPQVVDGSDDGSEQAVPNLRRRRDVAKEAAWGQQGLALLDNYWRVENAAAIQRPNPVQREVWVKAKLSLDAALGVTAAGTASSSLHDNDNGNAAPRMGDSFASPTPPNDEAATALSTAPAAAAATNDANVFLVRGIVDRLDMVQDASDKSAVTLRLIDYKSGKAPDLKYSAAMNRKIQTEAFEQLLIYALLLRESGKAKDHPMPLRHLRLFYLTSAAADEAVYWDLDLGATQEERDVLLQSVHATLIAVWRDIGRTIDAQDAKAFAGCQRSFCYCHKCRPRFVPGTVWEP